MWFKTGPITPSKTSIGFLAGNKGREELLAKFNKNMYTRDWNQHLLGTVNKASAHLNLAKKDDRSDAG